MRPCPFTGVQPQLLRGKIYSYVSNALHKNYPDRARMLNTNTHKHAVYGEFPTKETQWKFYGFEPRPTASIAQKDVKITNFYVSMLDDPIRQLFHPTEHVFLETENTEPTSLTLYDLVRFVPPPPPRQINTEDIKRAESIVYSVMTQMFGLDAHTATKYAGLYVKDGHIEDYDNLYDETQVRDIISWTKKRLGK